MSDNLAFTKFVQDLGEDKHGLNVVNYGMTESGIWIPQRVNNEGQVEVQSVGSVMEHFGPTESERPDVSEVPVGAVYMAINTEEVWQSNGFEWVVRA